MDTETNGVFSIKNAFDGPLEAFVLAVSTSPTHDFSKDWVGEIELVVGEGVLGDAHLGRTVQHRSRVAKDPSQPNLRQVHLMHAELFDELIKQGFVVSAGDLGENICTRGIDLLALPTATELRIGESTRLRITGLRNPCVQIDRFQKGLMAAVLGRDAAGELVRKAGVMAIVLAAGVVRPGDRITAILPNGPHEALQPV